MNDTYTPEDLANDLTAEVESAQGVEKEALLRCARLVSKGAYPEIVLRQAGYLAMLHKSPTEDTLTRYKVFENVAQRARRFW